MDADGRIIPIVEGDQGEGFKDEVDPLEDPSYTDRLKEMEFKRLSNLSKPRKEAIFKNIGEPKPRPQPQRLKMQIGMPINFYGYQYKVTRVMSRGRVMLKLLGEIPEKGESR